jgi:hypothetical protein
MHGLTGIKYRSRLPHTRTDPKTMTMKIGSGLRCR